MNEPQRGAVLVVDDDPAARETLESILSDEHDVECVPNVALAEATLNARSFDVVVTDYEMPGASGLQLLRKLLDDRPEVVGILVTGHGRYPEIERARRNWRDFPVLLKPYDAEALLRAVRNAVGIATLRRATRRLQSRPGPRR